MESGILFDCPRCDSRQQKPRPLDLLREHIARVHLDNLAIFICPRCHASFVGAHMANHHIKNVCKVEEFLPVTAHTRNILGMDGNYLIELQRLENEAIALRMADPPAPIAPDLDDIYMMAKAYGYKLVKDTVPQEEQPAVVEPSTVIQPSTVIAPSTGSNQPTPSAPPRQKEPTDAPINMIDLLMKRKNSEDKGKKPKQKRPTEVKQEEFVEEEVPAPNSRQEAPSINQLLTISPALLAYEKQVYCQPCKEFHPEDTKCPKLLNILFSPASPPASPSK